MTSLKLDCKDNYFMETTITFIFFILLGLCWGSFLNVIAYRLTFDQPFFTHRSYCPSCKNMIAFYDNIPIISWLVLKQKCRKCKAPISWIYPFIEATTGILVTALALHIFGWSFTESTNLPSFLAYFIFYQHSLLLLQPIFMIWLFLNL